MTKVDISIVVPSYNTKELLENCLKSICLHVPKKYNLEVIVVDNASSDGSPELISRNFKKVRIIKNNSNLGFARAVNQGWKVAAGKYVIFLNSDTVLENNAFELMADYIKDHPAVGAVSGKLVLRNGQIDPDTHRGFPTPWSSFTFFTGLEKLFPKSKIFGQYHMGYEKMTRVHEIDAGAGALLLVPKTILEKIGGWDETYFFYGEDIDLCYRIKSLDKKIVFLPDTQVVHYKGASSGLRRESKDIARPSRENLIRVTKGSIAAWKVFYQKFYQDKYPKWLTWLVLFGMEIKGSLRLLVNKYKPI